MTTRSYPLSSLRGLTATEVNRLKKAGIDSTKELLDAAPTTTKERALAQATGLTQTRMREAVNRADLVQVSGIGPATADLFENAGVNSAKELAQRNATNLWAVLDRYVSANPELNHRLPSPVTVASLVEKAKALAAAETNPIAPTPGPSTTGPTAEIAAKHLKLHVASWYIDHRADVPWGGNDVDAAMRAVKASAFSEVTEDGEDPHGHDLSQFQIFSHPDVVFPGSDNVWYVAFDRASGKFVEAYSFN